MASLDELGAALINADKAGDANGARLLAGEIQRMRAAESPAPAKIGVEGLPEAVKAVAGDFHPATQMAVGAKSAWDLAAMRLKQLVGGTLTPQQETETRANRALLEGSPMALLGNIATNMAATAPMIGASYGGVSSLASKGLPSYLQFLAPSAGAAAVGALTPALTQPVLQGESTLRNAGQGALAGVLADAALRGTSRLVQPITQSPAVQKLLNYDVIPTPGSAAGGMMKTVEDKLQSLPFVGDLIKGRQVGAREELNRAALGLGTPPGQSIAAVGREGIEQGKDAFASAYGKVYQGSNIGIDKQLLQDLAAAKNAPIVPMSSDEIKKFDQIVQREILDRLPGQSTLPTTEAKTTIEANLGKAVAKSEGPLQDALKAARDSFRSAMGRSVGPQAAAEVKAVDKAYSAFADVKKAAKIAEGNEGVFTPRQLQRVAKPGELKNLANAAQQVLPSVIPNSGTTDRALLNWLLLSGGAMGANQASGMLPGREGQPFMNPAFLAALAISPALYSRAGARYMTGDLIPGQPALAAAIRQASPYAAQGGALYAPYR